MKANGLMNDQYSVVGKMLDLIFEMRNVLPSAGTSLAFEQIGHFGGRWHFDIIAKLVSENKPITMILPAFPAKSPNRQKTLGALPDLGEVLALQRLQKLCLDIGEVYHPGAEVIICSDGRVFSDLVLVPDEDVSAYSRGIRQILRQFDLTKLSTFDLDDVVPGARFEDLRAYLVETYSEPLESVKEKVLRDPEFKMLFNGIHRFLFEDDLVLKPHLTRTKCREQSKQRAYQVIQRSNAWSSLLENHFETVIRLSIHPQPINSRKIGVRLLPSEDLWRTPWHSVPVFDGEGFILRSRKEAIELGASAQIHENGFSFYSLVAREKAQHEINFAQKGESHEPAFAAAGS